MATQISLPSSNVNPNSNHKNPKHMTTVVLSTPQMAQKYAERTGLQYDRKGNSFVCYDDSGEPIYTIKFYVQQTEIVDIKKVWEIYNPNTNRYEEYFTKQGMLEDLDFNEMHIPYESIRTTHNNGTIFVSRVLMQELFALPFSAELINLQGMGSFGFPPGSDVGGFLSL